MILEISPYTDIANAIIISAAEDYKRVLLLLKRNPDSKYARIQAKRLENYFYSSEFEELTDLNPDYLIRKMKEYVNELFERSDSKNAH